MLIVIGSAIFSIICIIAAIAWWKINERMRHKEWLKSVSWRIRPPIN